MKDAQSLFAKMYEQAGGAAGQAGPGPQAGAGADPMQLIIQMMQLTQTTKKCRLIKRVY